MIIPCSGSLAYEDFEKTTPHPTEDISIEAEAALVNFFTA
jgi:hypothetical protein